MNKLKIGHLYTAEDRPDFVVVDLFMSAGPQKEAEAMAGIINTTHIKYGAYVVSTVDKVISLAIGDSGVVTQASLATAKDTDDVLSEAALCLAYDIYRAMRIRDENEPTMLTMGDVFWTAEDHFILMGEVGRAFCAYFVLGDTVLPDARWTTSDLGILLCNSELKTAPIVRMMCNKRVMSITDTQVLTELVTTYERKRLQRSQPSEYSNTYTTNKRRIK